MYPPLPDILHLKQLQQISITKCCGVSYNTDRHYSIPGSLLQLLLCTVYTTLVTFCAAAILSGSSIYIRQ